MAEENIDEEKKSVRATTQKNAFPRIPLRKVLPLAKTIYELGEGDPVPRLVVFDKLGKSPESGPSRMLITTSNAYGLTTGSYQAERLSITERGKAIVTSEGSKIQEHIIPALLSNNLFKSFYEKYVNKSLPSEPIGIDYLKQSGALNDQDAKTAYEVFVENLKTYGLTKELSGRLTIIPLTMMKMDLPVEDTKEKSGKKIEIPSQASSQQLRDPIDSGQAPSINGLTPAPQFNFNIQIEIPDNASKETYDNIFKSIAENLLKSYVK